MAPLILDGRSLTPESVEKVAFGEEVAIDGATQALRDKGRRIELDLTDVFTADRVELGRAALARAHSPVDLLTLPFAKEI